MDASSSSNAAQLPPMEVLSYGGTSQYTAGGPSACGLASVNAALLVLSLFSNASSTEETLETIRSQGFVEKIMNICSLWKQEGHLDVDDILALPLFTTHLGTLAVEGNWCGPESFHALCGLLRDDTATVAIITRPPEIVALFNIPSGDPERPSIPILFDSHPRPHLHPKGAAFIFFLDEEGPIKYLSSLFETDKSLVESKTWDASLLGQYTAHVLKLKVATPAEAERAFYQANIRILEEQASLRDAATREMALSAELGSLRGRLALQQQQIDRAMAEETASREELWFLRREVERLKRVSGYHQMPGSWVEVASRRSEPPRKPLMNEYDHELAVSLQNGYAKHAAFGESSGSATGHKKTSDPVSFWQRFNGKRSSSETENLNPSDESYAYEQARRNVTREQVSRQQGKATNTLTHSPTHSTSRGPRHLPNPPYSPFPTTTNDDASRARALQAQLDSEQASYELARQLQAQEEAVIQEHQRLMREEANFKVFDCVVCMEKYPHDFSAPIDSCGHVLCRSCMKDHVQAQLDQSLWPIRCPLCVADQARTDDHGVVTRALVETLGINEAVLAKWNTLEMDKVSVAVECPSCHKTAPVDAIDFREATELTCPRGCGAHWCKQCNRTFDFGGIHSCDGQAEMDQLLGQQNWKKCPACQVPVEKTHGCNHMTCRCHCHFCYTCGGEITRSTHKRDIDRELQAHYRSNCQLFHYR